jgi:molybdate transport system regulatory protein
MPNPEPHATLKIRIQAFGIYAMGPGKADLLEAVAQCQSIAAAGRQLGYSYWKTRHLIDEMNQCFREPVVTTVKGGKERGGATVTALGHEALRSFRAMEAKASLAIQGDLATLEALLATIPAPR